MQKSYKHYIIKSTANNKRYKLYNKDEPNVEIFMSPYLSDVMAFISIEENELYVADEFDSVFPAQAQQDRDIWSSKHRINPDWTPVKAAAALEQLNSIANHRDAPVSLLTHPETGEQIVAPIAQLSLADDTGFKPKPIIKKKPIVKKKTSMKMKKKA